MAETDPVLKAYAEGYMTHVGGDVVGHPYVNAVVGGPYRNHVLRHMVLDNIMDTWIWDHVKSEDIITAALNDRLELGNDFYKIARHLVDVVDKVYVSPSAQPAIHPGLLPAIAPTEEDWETAYKALLVYLELSTDTGLTPPVPPPMSFQDYYDIVENYIEGATSGIAEVLPDWDDPLDVVRFALAGAVTALGYLAMLLDIPGYLLRRVANNALEWHLYLIELATHQFILDIRWLLSLSGWAKPSRADLSRPLAQTAFRIPADRAGPNAFHFPYQQVDHNVPFFWLVDPNLTSTMLEMYEGMPDGNESCPFQVGETPDVLIRGDAYVQSRDTMLRAFADADTAQTSISLAQQTNEGPQFGNAVNFTLRLLNQDYPAASFDLDGDMGYGYLSWEGPPPEYGAELT